MHQSSPFWQFHPDSLGWLHRRHDAGESVSRDDVLRFMNVDPANCSDPIWQDYNRRALQGDLDRKAPGRPRSPDIWSYRYTLAKIMIEDRAKEIAEERRSNLTGERGQLEPSVQAANEVGHFLKIQQGRTLLNILSKRRPTQKAA